MKADNLRNVLGSRPALLIIGAVQWLLLTATLGALIIHTDRSFEGLIDYHIQAGYAFFGALLIGVLFGATIESSKVLAALVLLACATAAGMYVAVLYTPVWTGVIVSTPGLQNFATSRSILHFGLIVVPTAMGAVLGQLIGPMLPGGDLLKDPRRYESENWWLTRRSRDQGEAEAGRRSS
jgi:hypothetical protein